jgi:hypothetical protein
LEGDAAVSDDFKVADPIREVPGGGFFVGTQGDKDCYEFPKTRPSIAFIPTRRRELAEKVLLKLIEVSPAATMASEEGEGIRLAWRIAEAFLKAENS